MFIGFAFSGKGVSAGFVTSWSDSSCGDTRRSRSGSRSWGKRPYSHSNASNYPIPKSLSSSRSGSKIQSKQKPYVY